MFVFECRYFWCVVILMNVALLIVLIHTIVTKLLWPDVTTKIQMSWGTNAAYFPAVTICNSNQFKVIQHEWNVFWCDFEFNICFWAPCLSDELLGLQKSFANESVEVRRILGEWYPHYVPYFFASEEEWEKAVETINLKDLDILGIFRKAAHGIQVRHGYSRDFFQHKSGLCDTGTCAQTDHNLFSNLSCPCK